MLTLNEAADRFWLLDASFDALVRLGMSVDVVALAARRLLSAAWAVRELQSDTGQTLVPAAVLHEATVKADEFASRFGAQR